MIRQQTMLANVFRAHLAEFGIVVVQGIRHVRELIEEVSPRISLIFPPWCVRLFGCSSRSSWNSDYRSSRSKRTSLPGIRQARKAGGWKRSPEWGLLRRLWNRLSSARINQDNVVPPHIASGMRGSSGMHSSCSTPKAGLKDISNHDENFCCCARPNLLRLRLFGGLRHLHRDKGPRLQGERPLWLWVTLRRSTTTSLGPHAAHTAIAARR